MKILHIIDHWGLGGAQRTVVNLANTDREHHHEVACLFAHGRHPWPLVEGTPLHVLVRSYGRICLLPWLLRRLVKRVNPDVIQIHLNGSRFLTAPALWRLSPRPTRVWHEHSGIEILHLYGRLPGKLLVAMQKRLLGGVDALVANSRDTAEFCRLHLAAPREKTHILGCPLDEAAILEQAGKGLAEPPPGPTGDGPIIGFVGRLNFQKGWQDVLTLADATRRTHPEYQLWIVGDGPDKALLRADIEARDLRQRVLFWGERGDVFAIMNRLSVLVVPSRFEPFGMVAAEAMVLGKPVVGYAVNGLAELLEGHRLGFAVTPNRPDLLAAAVADVLRSPPAKVPSGCDFGYLLDRWQTFYGRFREGSRT